MVRRSDRLRPMARDGACGSPDRRTPWADHDLQRGVRGRRRTPEAGLRNGSRHRRPHRTPDVSQAVLRGAFRDARRPADSMVADALGDRRVPDAACPGNRHGRDPRTDDRHEIHRVVCMGPCRRIPATTPHHSPVGLIDVLRCESSTLVSPDRRVRHPHPTESWPGALPECVDVLLAAHARHVPSAALVQHARLARVCHTSADLVSRTGGVRSLHRRSDEGVDRADPPLGDVDGDPRAAAGPAPRRDTAVPSRVRILVRIRGDWRAHRVERGEDVVDRVASDRAHGVNRRRACGRGRRGAVLSADAVVLQSAGGRRPRRRQQRDGGGVLVGRPGQRRARLAERTDRTRSDDRLLAGRELETPARLEPVATANG